MEQRGEEIHTSETEASGGSKEGVVRWVLIIGTLLAIVALTLVWMGGAANQEDGADSETSVSNTIQAEEAKAEDRGEPIAPAMEKASDTPAADTMPGDAPAGDPKADVE